MTTCFGRAWPSSGHKLFTINISKEKTYTWSYSYCTFVVFNEISRRVLITELCVLMISLPQHFTWLISYPSNRKLNKIFARPCILLFDITQEIPYQKLYVLPTFIIMYHIIATSRRRYIVPASKIRHLPYC